MTVEPKLTPAYEFCRICGRPYDASASPHCPRHAPASSDTLPDPLAAINAIGATTGTPSRRHLRRLAVGLSAVALPLALFTIWSAGFRDWRDLLLRKFKSDMQQVAPKQAQTLAPERIPFISDRDRTDIGAFYMSAPDYKALAISFSRIGMIAGQSDMEAAKKEALERCSKALEAARLNNECYLYALGNTVVYEGGYPHMPPQPWLRSDPSIARPLNSKDIPLIREDRRSWIEKDYLKARKSKAIALSPQGLDYRFWGVSSQQEAVRRALEACGSRSGVACMIIAVDDNFVVPIPVSVKVTGFFRPAEHALIAPHMRDEVARRLAEATSGWNAVASGAGGFPGVASGAASEQSAVEGALMDCGKHDHDCRVLAIGPFSVEAQLPMAPPPGTQRANSPCSEERNTHSIEARQPAMISFRNESPMPVRIFWIDYAGRRVLYKEIASGQRHNQSTFLTHPWVVTDVGSNCLGFYLPQEQPREYILR